LPTRYPGISRKNERKKRPMRKKLNTKKAIGMLLIFAFLMSVVTSVHISPVNAQAAITQQTYALVDAIPNPTGVGQSTLLKFGISQALGSADLQWTGITMTITKPDGTTETLGPFVTDSTGSSFTQYTPTQVGNYTITTNFPNNTVAAPGFMDFERGSYIMPGTIMLASTATMTLEVTTEPLVYYPGHALPTEYWSRPIDPQLREWYSISGNWVTMPDNALALYNDNAPTTAHTLWAKDLTTGGLTGGLWGDGQIQASSESGDAYEGKFQSSVIINGILYYNVGSQGIDAAGIQAVDLHTGKDLWFKSGETLAFGQILYWNSYNVDGVYTYLWTTSMAEDFSTTWTAYDPFNGEWEYTFTNVPSGIATTRGPSGEILIYQIDFENGWMALWNSTLCGLQTAARGTPDMGSFASNVHMKTLDASNPLSYSWNVTIPKGLQAGTSFFAPFAKVYPDRIMSIFFNQTKVEVWALNLAGLTKTSTSTTLLFNEWWSAPSEWLTGSNTLHYSGATNYVKDGVIAVWDKELRIHYGFSVETGKYLWATAPEHYLDMYGWGNVEHTWYYAYGKLYSVGVAGILYAYDLKTGATTWTYKLTDAYKEPVTGENWWGWIDLITDGKIYLGTLEHSAEQPLPRGAPYICVNATDGTEIFRVNGMYRETRWGGNGIIGDSIIATMDTYDQRIYAIGKGASALTVNAPSVSVDFGKTIVIQGSVTDISPGTQTDAVKMRFPNGVPAVSDTSQSQWMLYVYKQFECPTDASGVPLIVSVLDANGNNRVVGTTTSDLTGAYKFSWKPDISGDYTVYVTFAGSGAYYGSVAQSAFFVENEVAATAAPTPTPASTADTYFVPAIAGLFVLIIIVLVLLVVMMMKKRP
jgi:hypothetical protein